MSEKKHYCRNCKGERNHKIVSEKKTGGSYDDYLQWSDYFYIIECLGCNNISFLKIYSDTEMMYYNEDGEPDYADKIEIFPLYLENLEELSHTYYLPPKIRIIYNETVSALKSKLYLLAAGGLRAIIEATCNHLKIKKADLSVRIDLLHEKGHLSLNESKRLHSIRFLGNDALHEIEIPNKGQINILLEIVNHLLENLFIQDKKLVDNIVIVIDKYDDFLKAIRNNITDKNIAEIKSINELLGKSRRLIKSKYFVGFVEQLNAEIKEAKIDFLSLEEDSKYKIEKKSEFTFEF
jgi:hypothetical protein